jgi:pyruvate dehydrogenase (quinone)
MLPLIRRKENRSFLGEAQQRMTDWNAMLDKVENVSRSPLRPQMVVRGLSDLLADDAIVSLDCGANTHFAARCLRLKEKQRLTGTGCWRAWRLGCRSRLPRNWPIPPGNLLRWLAMAVLPC